MSRTDVISRWAGTVQFALISSPRRLVLASYDKGTGGSEQGRRVGWDYIEIDNRSNKGAVIYWSVNGSTASSALSATFAGVGGVEFKYPNFRTASDSIERLFIRATSISALATGNATTVFINVGKY